MHQLAQAVQVADLLADRVEQLLEHQAQEVEVVAMGMYELEVWFERQEEAFAAVRRAMGAYRSVRA